MNDPFNPLLILAVFLVAGIGYAVRAAIARLQRRQIERAAWLENDRLWQARIAQQRRDDIPAMPAHLPGEVARIQHQARRAHTLRSSL